MKQAILFLALVVLSPLAHGQSGCFGFYPVDVFVNMNGQSPGTSVTETNLAAGTEISANYSGWNAASSSETFAASQVSLPYAITVNGGTAHGCNYATQSLELAANATLTGSQMGFSSKNQVVVSGIIANLPPYVSGSGSFLDMVYVEGLSGNTAVIDFNYGNEGYCGGYGFGIEWSLLTERVTHCLTGVSPGQSVYFTFHVNYTSSGTCSGMDGSVSAPCAEASFYQIVNNQIGPLIGAPIDKHTASATTTLADIEFGNMEAGTSANPYYFQDMMVDYTNVVYPNLPRPWNNILLPTVGTNACTVAPSDVAAECAIDWTQAGISGGIPSYPTQSGSSIVASACGNGSSDCTSTINTALSSCGGTSSAMKYVQLGTGTFTVLGTLSVPSYCQLNGNGANNTTLNIASASTSSCGQDDCSVSLGSGAVSYSPITVSSGATAGSTQLTLASTSGVSAGGYLVVTDTNDSWVTPSGGEGNCNWCDGSWTSTATLARGQIVEVESLSGSVATIWPPLYTAYSNSPIVVPFTAAAKYASLSNLKISGNGSNNGTDVSLSECAYCSVTGVEIANADVNWLEIGWGYRDEVDSNYFSGTLLHTPSSGAADGDIDIFNKTSASKFENNICERGHVECVMLEWGAAGNVIDYNYALAGFDSGGADWASPSFTMHGAHPQFNLFEGNVGRVNYEDEIWGSSSHNTHFRNWWTGTNLICNAITSPFTPVTCSPTGYWEGTGVNSWLAFTYSYAEDIAHWSWYDNFVGEVIGSSNQQGLPAFSGTPESNVAILNWTSAGCSSSGCRDVGGPGAVAYNMTFGFGETNDNGSGTGCDGGVSPCHSVDAWETSYIYNTYTFSNTTTNCLSGGSSSTCSTSIPASFIYASKPSWWGGLAWPSIGPDVTGGNGPGGHVASKTAANAAQNCYLGTMGGSDGGPASPLTFNANTCYSATSNGQSAMGWLLAQEQKDSPIFSF